MSKTVQYSIVAFVIIGIIVGIILYARRQKKKAEETASTGTGTSATKTSTSTGTSTTKTNTGTTTSQSTTQATPKPAGFDPNPLADALFREMDNNGVWDLRDSEPYNKMNALPDAQFRMVNDAFNATYKSRVNNKTFRQALGEERVALNISWYNATQKVLTRLSVLGIK